MKEVARLACEVARGRGGEAMNMHEGGGAVGMRNGTGKRRGGFDPMIYSK
jgi:hypothetical protein